MALVINTNVASLTAQRNLTGTQQILATSLQRLSSGLRINSAKDDAAGMFSVERMTADIRGMNQAVRNAADGISLAQTAEGALAQVNSALQRIREIAVQSANDTVEDRSGLQSEVNQLTREISRIIQTTEFNGTSLLSASSTLTFQVGTDGTVSNQISVDTTDLTAVTAAIDPAVSAAAQAIVDELASGFGSADAMINAEVQGIVMGTPGVIPVTIGTVTLSSANNEFTSTDDISAAAIAVYEAAEAVYNAGGGEICGVTTAQLTAAAQAVADTYNSAGTVTLNSYNSDLTASTTIDVGSRAAAAATLAQIDADIDRISSTRSTFGAIQNRFEAVITNLQSYSENLSAARSRILDADFATETAQLTRAQILQQAGVSMLAQANTLPQTALALLR